MEGTKVKGTTTKGMPRQMTTTSSSKKIEKSRNKENRLLFGIDIAKYDMKEDGKNYVFCFN